jgi:predicted transposase YdaD
MIDHDRLFKELIQTFFLEFLELFLPPVAGYLDPRTIHFLDKELFTDVTSGDRHEADLVAKARFRNQDAFFLVHVETQSAARDGFAARMFRYFARLHEKHSLPVYPIALFSYDAPHRPEADVYQITFPDREVMRFTFAVIQLNRLNWRDFLRSQNPIASALMARMNIAAEDRPRVKLECLRLLATFRLNPAKMQMISGFIDTYLQLAGQEQAAFQAQLQAIAPQEKETLMQITTSWEREGIRKGKADLVTRLLRRRFGDLPGDLQDRINSLEEPRLSSLGEALLDFSSLADVDTWLASHA